MQEPSVERPWEFPGNTRLDCSLHRGHGLHLAGRVAQLSGILSLFTCGPALIAFPIGLVVVILSERDIAKMHFGQIDPRGRLQTSKAWRLGLQGMLFSAAAALLWVSVGCWFRYYHL